MRRYPHVATFQGPTVDRDAAGGVSYTYDNVTGLVDVPARVLPHTEEEAGERNIVTRDLWQLVLEGDRDVEPDMAALTDVEDGVFNVLRVARPQPGLRPVTTATIVVAERVAL